MDSSSDEGQRKDYIDLDLSNGTGDPKQDNYRPTTMSDKTTLIDKREPGWAEDTLRPCMAEFVGTTLFVFIGTMSYTLENGIGVGLAHGMAAFFLVAMTKRVSGGHLNPVVTLGHYMVDKIKIKKAVLYFIVQVLGGILGSALCRACTSHELFIEIQGGAHRIGTGIYEAQAILNETIITAALITVYMLTMVDDLIKVKISPIAIGFCVCANILASFRTTGGGMNPARSFGPCVTMWVYEIDVWDYHYVYWLGPTLGCILAIFGYKSILAADEEKRWVKFKESSA